MQAPADPQAQSPSFRRMTVARHTRLMHYPSIAFRKLKISVDRATAVHARFQKEIESIAEQIRKQDEIAAHALGRCEGIAPLLLSLTEEIKNIIGTSEKTRGLVVDGREKLQGAVTEVKAAIEQVRARNESMRGILSISERIGARVNDIADIAVENKIIAINASITASKASDKVKGFKVIAGEITAMSAAMAERVDSIVGKAAGIGERVSRIMSQMDGSIRSTEEALRSIDEAFALLAQIDETILSAKDSASGMMDEDEALAGDRDALAVALQAIRVSVARNAELSTAVKDDIIGQGGRIDSYLAKLPDASRIVETIAHFPSRMVEPDKTLRMSELPIATFDPALANFVRETHYSNFTCIRLLRYSSDRKVVPYLADSWSLLDDERTWDFKLKEGVRFCDGSEITTEDVKFSLERVMNPALGSPYADLLTVIEGADAFRRGEATEVSGIRMLGPYSLRIVLKSSYNFLLGLLAHNSSSILKKNPAFFSHPFDRDSIVSAGPFKSAPSPDPNADLLEVNPLFVNGAGFYDRLEIRRNVTDLPAAFADGSVEVAYNIPAADERHFREKGFDGEIRRYVSKYCTGLIVNFTRDNWLSRHAELRRAVCMAIDKDAILEEAFGHDIERADCVLQKSILDTGGRIYIPYDPEEARRIVESYRGKEDFETPLTVVVADNALNYNGELVSTRIAESLRAIGLNLRVVMIDASLAKREEYRKYDLTYLRFMPETDLYMALEPFINPEGGDNYFHYSNPAIFEELKGSFPIKEDSDRRRYFLGLIEKFTLDVFMVPLFHPKMLAVSAKTVTNIVLSPDESFFPDLAYPAETASAEAANAKTPGSREAEPLARRAQATLPDDYAPTIEELVAGAETISTGAGTLIHSVEEMLGIIFAQEREIADADNRIRSFIQRADKLRQRREGVIAAMRMAAEESTKSTEAARMILESLSSLTKDLQGTAESLETVKKAIRDMLAVAAAIEASNSVIGSVAINAAIIAAKADSSSSDLVKVSKSISELAQLNAENTLAVQDILRETDESVASHSAGINESLASIIAASRNVGASGAVLQNVAPALGNAEKDARRVEEISNQLGGLIEDTSASVLTIRGASRTAQNQAEAMRIGIALERAVVDIINDVVSLNSEISQFMARQVR